jgi:hypothetical protein
MAGTLTVSGLAAGLLSGEKVIGPLTMTGGATIGTIIDAALASGDNTIAIPAGAVACVVVLPASGTVTVKVRTNANSGDGGLPIGATGYVVFPIASGVTSLIVNATGSTTAELSFI